MPLPSGTQLVHYEILEPIGKGGMGDVYRGKDRKLGRDVAIKVLPNELTNDRERVARFEREAKVLASLNHPNIAGIYGFEESNGIKALVLELVEGPTLADRIAKGPIPVDEALPIARQIAEALEAGHEAGVIHRDLKPANIKLKEDGTVKVLDYGLAKALEGEVATTANSELSQSPTLTRQGTQMDVILGTPAYMSPEQARGKRIDKRTDVWAFGAVLHEMLSGKRAFAGEDVSDTLAAVLRAEPDLEALPAATPMTLRRLLLLCLTKDLRRRVRDIGDVRLAMDGAFETEAQRTSRSRSVLPWAVTVLASLIAILSLISREGAVSSRDVAAQFAVSVGGELPARSGFLVALSPNGRELVYAAITEEGDQLYQRSMNRLEAVPLPGTAGARAPFFSPDGQWVAFSSGEGRLEKVSIFGGAKTTICSCIPDVDGAWGPDGTIVFSDSATGVLVRVSSNGGIPEPITTLAEGEVSHDNPAFLPSGEAVLFTVWSSSLEDARVAMVSLATGERRILGEGYFPRLASTGHLIYGRSGALWAVPFDADRLETTGDAVQVMEHVRVEGGGAMQLDFAENGTAVYIDGRRSRAERALVWVDREGHEEPLPVPGGAYQSVSISPDGTRIVFEVLGSGLEDIWIYDVRAQRASQLTFDATDDLWPIWAPDGERVLFVSQRGGPYGLYSKRVDGTGRPEQVVSLGGLPVPWSMSSDGTYLAYHDATPESGFDLLSVVLEAEPRLQPLLASRFQEFYPEISPDGRWLAYVSDESGQREIYVSPFSDPAGGKWRVSRDGGTEPVWSADGRELFYRNGTAVLAVSTETGSVFAAGEPRLLFTGPNYQRALTGHTYDVMPDGRTFVMIRESETGPAEDEIIVIENWFEELERLVPTDN